MEQKIFHGGITPTDVAQALLAEFNHGNLRAQLLGQGDKLAVQISTRPGASSGGQTALTVSIQKFEDGIVAAIGEQDLLGVAASLGTTALWAWRNPFNLIGRLGDVAQDIENLQLHEHVWRVIEECAQALGASKDLSERLRRLECDYCGTANPVGEAACIACGAPMGSAQPGTCPHCGFVLKSGERQCPNCGSNL